MDEDDCARRRKAKQEANVPLTFVYIIQTECKTL